MKSMAERRRKVLLSVNVTPEQDVALRIQSGEIGVSVAELVRRGIDRELQEHAKLKEAVEDDDFEEVIFY